MSSGIFNVPYGSYSKKENIVKSLIIIIHFLILIKDYISLINKWFYDLFKNINWLELIIINI